MIIYLFQSSLFSALVQNKNWSIIFSLSFILIFSVTLMLLSLRFLAREKIHNYLLIGFSLALILLAPVFHILNSADPLIRDTYGYKNGIFMTSSGLVYQRIFENFESTFEVVGKIKCEHSLGRCNEIIGSHKEQVLRVLRYPEN